MNAPERIEWLARRRSGIGGSDIAALLGLSPWSTPLDVYESKVSDQHANDGGNEAMRWGTLLEDVVAREFAQRERVRVQRVNSMLRHPEHAFAIANIDRAIVDDGTRARVAPNGLLAGANELLEVKTVSAFAGKDWGDDDTPRIPLHYAAQGMWYLGVTGVPRLRFACLIGGQRYVVRTLDRDEDAIAAMFDAAGRFWREHVESNVPPPPTRASDVARVFKRDDGTMLNIDNDGDTLASVARLLELRERIKALETEAESISDALKLAIGSAAGLAVRGTPVVTWKASKDSKRTDWAAVADALRTAYCVTDAAYAGIVETHTTTAQGSRRLILK